MQTKQGKVQTKQGKVQTKQGKVQTKQGKVKTKQVDRHCEYIIILYNLQGTIMSAK